MEGEPDCVWTDGHYDWDGSWMWRPGRWVLPRKTATTAPGGGVVKTRDPKLYYSPPRWYREERSALPEARAVCGTPPCVPWHAVCGHFATMSIDPATLRSP